MALRFLDYSLDADDARLRRGSEVIALRPKTMAVLCYLAERPGRLVTKSELLDRVWSDAVVGESSLTGCIKELRSAFDDDPRVPRIIETVHRRGYRFIAPVDGAATTASVVASAAVPDLVGRDGELVELEACLRRSVDGERQVVFVGGEPGIGKTALVEAFCERVSGPTLVASGQCIEQHGAGEPYLPVLEALGRLAAGPAGESIVAQLRRHAPSWLAQLPDVVEADEREVLQRRLAGTTPHGMLHEAASFVAALPSPLVLVLEDLHWSDYATIDLLALLARRRDRAPLLLIATFRPIDVALREHPLAVVHRELQAHRQCRDLWMSHLSVEAVAAYLRVRWPGLAAVERHARGIHEHTDGNPLFMVSLLDHLEESGTVVERDGAWAMSDVWDTAVAVPRGLRQTIDSHVERLSAEDRDVLEAGSLVGRRFSAALAAAALEIDTVGVETRLERLARREQLVRPSGETAWPDGTVSGAFELTHSLYQRALRERVGPARRRRLHELIGERLESVYGAQRVEIAAELAFHFEASGQTERAAACLLDGAERAMRRGGQRDAAPQLQHAIALVESLPRTPERILATIRMYLRLGSALTQLYSMGDAAGEAAFERCRALAEETGDLPQLFQALFALNVSYIASARLSLAAEIVEQLDALRTQAPFPVLSHAADVALGMVRYHQSDLAIARRHLEAALSYDDPIPDISWSLNTTALSYLSLALVHLGYPDQGRARSRQARERAANGSGADQAPTVAFECIAHYTVYRGIGLLPIALNAVRVCSEHGFAFATLLAEAHVGFARVAEGDLEGIEQSRAAIERYRSSQQKIALPNLLAGLVQACLTADHIDDGFVALADARAAVAAAGEELYTPELHRLDGELHARRGATDEADACFRRAIDAAVAQGTRSWELRARLSLARRLAARGDGAAARETLRPIVELQTEGADLPDVQEARALVA